jgi:hypothetical protein
MPLAAERLVPFTWRKQKPEAFCAVLIALKTPWPETV